MPRQAWLPVPLPSLPFWSTRAGHPQSLAKTELEETRASYSKYRQYYELPSFNARLDCVGSILKISMGLSIHSVLEFLNLSFSFVPHRI